MDESEQRRTPRSRFGEWLFQIFGPPTVSGAIQGHSPEARAAWKRRVEEERAARRSKDT
ncbi:hypothetical protein [Cryptosporangium sp. NPDC051539]|uniref:hypothetical protein n=1 Tax=Cryptosporangium sp. NPDC051539 TaxID=3363962 RepID=UPI00378E11BA